MYKKLFLLLLSCFLVSACSIKQTIESAEVDKGSVICIIENPEVREGFLKTLESSLSSKGVPYKVVEASAIPESCEWTATYHARWTWDLALYMSYAHIQVFHKDKLDGQAIYDSTRGGGNMNKFIDAETKIRELVDQLIQYKLASYYRLMYG